MTLSIIVPAISIVFILAIYYIFVVKKKNDTFFKRIVVCMIILINLWFLISRGLL